MIFDNYPKIILATSTKDDGNMSFIKGNPEEALNNRIKFLKSLGINIDDTISPSLVHETNILIVEINDLGKGSKGLDSNVKFDGLITNKPEIFLFLLTGDCLPIAIFDPKKNVIGLIHAGWIGLDKGIIKKAVVTFINKFSSDLKDLLVYIAPSIGPCCYIKNNTKEAEENPVWQPYLKKMANGISIDLWRFATDQFINLGVNKNNIENSEICSYHSGKYFSNRQFKAENLQTDYRFATVFGMKN